MKIEVGSNWSVHGKVHKRKIVTVEYGLFLEMRHHSMMSVHVYVVRDETEKKHERGQL